MPTLRVQGQDGVVAQALQVYKELGITLGKALTQKARAAAIKETGKGLRRGAAHARSTKQSCRCAQQKARAWRGLGAAGNT